MPISQLVIEKFADATSALLHQRGFYEAFAIALQELEQEIPLGVNVDELRSAVGGELNNRKKAKDPIQVTRAQQQSIIFVINKECEVAFVPEGRHIKLYGVRLVGEGKKPNNVEVDGRLLGRAYHRAQKHFRELRKSAEG